MVVYVCNICNKAFKQKGHLTAHANKKRPCKKDNTIEMLVEEKVQSKLTEAGIILSKEDVKTPLLGSKDFNKMTRHELIAECSAHKLRGYSTKCKADLIKMLIGGDTSPVLATNGSVVDEPARNTVVDEPAVAPTAPLKQEILHADTLEVLPTLPAESAQIIIADPPYNIGKDFGNKSDKQPMDEYLKWSEKWIQECLRVLKPNGTMFIYGFSEILALILSRVPAHIQRRWVIWHYTNKNVASLNFWQRSHESILVLWKDDHVFHRDDIREAYTEGFLNGAAGRERTATKGRFSKGEKKTTYTAHPNGALPRDVIKIPALAGGAGMKERVNHPTQKPLALCDKLIRSCKQPASEGFVLVPFAGSGSECLSAKRNGLPFIGIELNSEYVELIKTRLNADDTATARVE
jgi:site-specific DNA-methyltransferase (adenine-specific)